MSSGGADGGGNGDSAEQRAARRNISTAAEIKNSLDNAELDPTTRAELQGAYNSAYGQANLDTGNIDSNFSDESAPNQGLSDYASQYANLQSIQNRVASASAGEGMYGIRRKNWELAKLLLDKPGSDQTILSTRGTTDSTPGGGTVLTGR